MKPFFVSLLFFLVAGGISLTHAQRGTQNYLLTNRTLNFQKKAFSLTWSSHPTPEYYKQEYLFKGESLAQYKTMLLLEVLSGSVKLAEVIEAKVNELKTLKANNPVVQYEVFSNAKNGEYLIDFLLTANAADGSTSIAERNVYRYKTIITKEGKPAVLLFGTSTRSYGKDITAFLIGLKATRKALINDVVQFSLPVIAL